MTTLHFGRGCAVPLVMIPTTAFPPPVPVGTCGAMPDVVVSLVLRLNGCSVPLETQTLPFVDPYNLAEEPDAWRGSKPQGTCGDCTKAWPCLRGGGCRTTICTPLLQEILGLIKGKKPKQGSQVLMPMIHKNLAPLQF